ncbi:precorrin-3B C(17)-methyltransferase [Dongia deserti]|uniref:precorrin-3B C(17)-methyltransferase n=1 Tax=Dongia deserti TaxID=2268030 RepID=UPI000E651B02|nr:precorrin-3B C(17)-methyltransferase [Dongia deserti]
MTDLRNDPAIIALSETGAALARRIQTVLHAGEVFGLEGRVADCDRAFSKVAAILHDVFAAGRPIIGICATGILIRTLAPFLISKENDPPVLAVAEDASVVVPLLGGHHGANVLATRLADALGGVAALTTASDVTLRVPLDAPPVGWRLRETADYKRVAAELLAGASARIIVEAGPIPEWLLELPQAADAPITVLVSERTDAKADLVYAPQTVVLGVGCERLAEESEVWDLVERSLAKANIAREAIACVTSIALKAAEPAIHGVARRLGVPARFFDAARLERETPRLKNPSDLVYRETGCHGVAEGAALAGVGTGGELILPKQRSQRATCALARSSEIVDPKLIGRARGSLAIVGIGPGAPAARTHEVEAAIRAATDLVGYKLYLDLLGPLAEHKARHGYELGEEEMRVRIALGLAAEGRDVALVCSGDAGIYAMATLVFELIEREGNADWARVAITGLPGVSAMQTAAARIGAPLGHDFCAISLSDLLTPWEAIEQRLLAAAAGDFVVAFYNPVSQRRRTQLAAAKEILLRHRPSDTPVVLARNLGREGETVTVVALRDLKVEDVDMLTLVIVGSSATRAVARPDGGVWVYTPRGYAKKMDAGKGAA